MKGFQKKLPMKKDLTIEMSMLNSNQSINVPEEESAGHSEFNIPVRRLE
jgi:hypothetical protein